MSDHLSNFFKNPDVSKILSEIQKQTNCCIFIGLLIALIFSITSDHTLVVYYRLPHKYFCNHWNQKLNACKFLFKFLVTLRICEKKPKSVCGFSGGSIKQFRKTILPGNFKNGEFKGQFFNLINFSKALIFKSVPILTKSVFFCQRHWYLHCILKKSSLKLLFNYTW